MLESFSVSEDILIYHTVFEEMRPRTWIGLIDILSLELKLKKHGDPGNSLTNKVRSDYPN